MNWWIEDKPWIVCRRQCRRTIAGSDPPRSSVLRLHFVFHPFDLDDLSWLSFYFYPLDLDDLSWDCLFFIHLIWMIWSEIEFFYTFDLDDLSWDCIFLFFIHLIWMICPEIAFFICYPFDLDDLSWDGIFIFIHLICLSIWFIYPFDWNDLSCDCILIFDLDENFVWYVNNHFNIEIIYSLARTKKWEVSGHDVNGMRGWREARKVLGSTRSLRTYFINHLPESACHQKVQFCVLRRGNEYLTLKNTWQHWGLISLT